MKKRIYNKLVRDKMIDVYEYDVKNRISATDFQVRYLSREEILHELKNKLQEEIAEVMICYDKMDKSELKEELADVIEVIDAILHHNGFALPEILEIRNTKKEKRGGFENGLYLESITYMEEKDPH